jgi:hypothetical protein
LVELADVKKLWGDLPLGVLAAGKYQLHISHLSLSSSINRFFAFLRFTLMDDGCTGSVDFERFVLLWVKMRPLGDGEGLAVENNEELEGDKVDWIVCTQLLCIAKHSHGIEGRFSQIG